MRAIPSTHEKLPVIGLGSALTFDVRGSRQLAPIGEVLALFVKHGGKLIDTSPAYGNAESVIGDLAYQEHLTSSLFFATKVWTRRQAGRNLPDATFPGAISDQVDRSGAGA